MKNTEFSQWLENKFIAWIAESGQRHTVTEFAEWLEIPRPLVSYYLSGERKPSRKSADLIAARLGPEVYDLLGFQRPDPLLQRLQAQWDRLTEQDRAVIQQMVERLENEPPGR